MLEDEDYCNSISAKITENNINAEYAVSLTAKEFSSVLENLEDSYMRERAIDIYDVSRRLISVLLGRTSPKVVLDKPVIIAADDLAPSETVQLDKTKIIAIVTSEGSANSHSAILSRAMGIPAVIGLGPRLMDLTNGMDLIVHGQEGIVYVEPDAETSANMEELYQQELEHQRLLTRLRGKPSVTKSGRELKVFANIGDGKEARDALAHGAEGVGLFRSEFLYLGRESLPPEEELFEAYRSAAAVMEGKPVVIRTIDIGADKQVDYLGLSPEENPAMGVRGIRLCLTHPELFRSQLRAIFKASAFGAVSIMFPMISAVWEIHECQRAVQEVRTELALASIPMADHVPIGIMIETPAAAILSDLLAREVDFFSIGTNDLAQYTLAADRQNRNLELFCDEQHEAVLRLMEFTCKNAKQAGIPVSICGELGSDLSLTERFLDMGVERLSVPPSLILPLREKIRSLA